MWWRLFWWIITTALTDLLQKTPPNAVPAGVGDFNIPTATEGRVVPIIIGNQMKINAPNCIWYGDYAALERIQTTGVIIKKDNVIGFTYELALAYALFKGESTGITGIWIGDEKVWDYEIDAASVPQTVVDVDRDDLFGGKNSGGGFVGRIRLFNGADDQAVSSFMASRIVEGVPAYRGTSYIMVTDVSELKGAEIGEAPNLRYINVEVQTMSPVASGGLGDSLNLGNDHHIIGKDANPVSLAYELFINPRWGRGMSPSDVDLASFQAAAETVWTEGIGFTMLKDEFTTTEEIRDTLEQHVDGYIGPNAQTGKFEIKLARQDYTLASEFQVDDTNLVLVKTWNKGDWSQTFNRVRMRYADRNKEWNETHAVANAPANRIIQGSLVSQEVRYPGVHEPGVANKIVAREKKNLSRPGRSGTIELNRTAWNLRPGDVISFTSSQAEETELATRITKAEVGDPVKNTMVFEIVEDFFDNETPNVAEPPATDFVPPTQEVDPLLAADQWAIESPFMITRQDSIAPSVSGRLVTAARLNTGAPTEYEIQVRDPGGSGSYVSSTFITGGFMLAGTLRNAEVGTLSGNGGKTMQVDPIAGSLDGLIGPQAPGSLNMTGVAVIEPGTANEEWIVFDDIVDDLTGIRLEGLYRGGLDSAMKAHSAGVRIWFIWTGGIGLTDQTFAENASIDVKLLPRSPSDAVPEGDATAITPVIFMNNGTRYGRPLLPAQVFIEGADYSSTGDLDTVYDEGGTDIQASAIAPRLRDWRVQDPLTQLQGVGLYGDVWGQDSHQISYWLYDLDVTPSPTRGNAIWSSLDIPCTFVTDGAVKIPKEDLRTYMEVTHAKNSFNARLEIETSHIPVGQNTSRIISRDFTLHDYLINGTYIVPFGAAYLHMHSDGDDGSTPADVSVNNHEVLMIGSYTGVDTAQSVFGGESLLAGKVSTSPINTSSGVLVNDDTLDLKDIDWTIEFRVRWSEITGTQIIVGQKNQPFNWVIEYISAATLRITGSTIGSSGLVNINVTLATQAGLFAVDTWYAIAISFKTTGAGVGIFSTFIDGVKQTTGTQGEVAFNIYNTTLSEVEVGMVDSQRSFVSGLATTGMDSGWIDELRILPGTALYAVPYTPEVTAYSSDLKFNSVFQASFDKPSGDDAAQQPWVFNGAGVRLSGDQAKFGFSSLEIDGGHEVGLEVGTTASSTINPEQSMFAEDFTFEGFVRFKVLPSVEGNDGYMGGVWTSSANGREWGVGVDTNGDVAFRATFNGITSIVETGTPGVAIAVDTWYHLAMVRDGAELSVYWDGTRVINSATFFTDTEADGVLGSNTLRCNLSIGKLAEDEGAASTSRPMNGFVDECRLVGRTAVYSGPTLTVPTAPFPKPHVTGVAGEYPDYANTSFHTHFEQSTTADPLWPDVMNLLELEGTDTATTTTDEGSLAPTWTFNGNAQIDTAQSAIGSSSLLLDGTGDWLSTPDVTDFDFLDQDFTIECFVRWAADPSGTQQAIISKWNNTGSNNSWALWYNSTVLKFSYSSNGSADQIAVQATWDPAATTWYHLAVVRRGTTTYLYVDGILLASTLVTTLTNTNRTAEVRIGAFATSGSELPFNGWIDQVRFTIGSPRYQPFGYIVPTAAAPQKLGGDILIDESNNDHPIFGVNDPVMSAAQTKFGTTSLLLDGVDQYAYINDTTTVELGALDFTVEAQIRFTALPTTGNRMTIVGKWDNDQNDKEWHLSYDADDGLVFEYTTNRVTAIPLNAAWSPSTATWYHVMVTRKNGFLHMFVDGTIVARHYIGTAIIPADTERWTIGALYGVTTVVNHFDGHIDEVRLVLNEARYIENFTAPTSEYGFHRTVLMQSVNRDVWRNHAFEDGSKYAKAIIISQCANVNDIVKFPTVPESHGGGYPASAQFGNGNGYWSIDDAPELKLRNADFTIEGWFYFLAAGIQVLCGEYDNTGVSRAWWLRYNSTLGALEFGWYVDGSTAKTAYADWTMSTATWYHLALTREGDTLRLFIDGVLQTLNVASDTMAADEEIIVTNERTTIGLLDVTAPTQRFTGRGQDFRMIRGKALYTATFTAPTEYLKRFD